MDYRSLSDYCTYIWCGMPGEMVTRNADGSTRVTSYFHSSYVIEHHGHFCLGYFSSNKRCFVGFSDSFRVCSGFVIAEKLFFLLCSEFLVWFLFVVSACADIVLPSYLAPVRCPAANFASSSPAPAPPPMVMSKCCTCHFFPILSLVQKLACPPPTPPMVCRIGNWICYFLYFDSCLKKLSEKLSCLVCPPHSFFDVGLVRFVHFKSCLKKLSKKLRCPANPGVIENYFRLVIFVQLESCLEKVIQ